MKQQLRSVVIAAALLAGLVMWLPSWAQDSALHHGYEQKNLVSNNSAFNPVTVDGNLVNSWGLGFFLGSPFWVADNGTGVSTLYDGQGTPESSGSPLVVTIPAPGGGTSAPTGLVANTTLVQFKVPGSPSSFGAPFIFDTEDGTIAAWDPAVNPTKATQVADNSTKICSNGAQGAVYKGLALGANAGGAFLYATNFSCGTVDVFDSSFTQISSLPGSFSDPRLPSGFAPFGIANIQGNLFVTYALQDADKHDDVAGPGNGFVDIFDTNGNLIQRFASRGKLNSPWGIAAAPFNFGRFSRAILIGNFGDGKINGFGTTGHFRGQLKDPSNKTIVIDGLWALVFGGALNSDPGTLYFTSGPNKESDGLFGSLTPQ
jgi:uncharacterized protein (TIGR03118 family)